MNNRSCALTKDVILGTPPTATQLYRYTEGSAVPCIERIEFKPGGRGRPRLGHETIVAESLDAVQDILRDGSWTRYKKIIVRFVGDCHNYEAIVERIFEKILLVIEGIGVVTSISVGIS